MARFTTLYSGSTGNASVIEENGKFLLVDMGASCRATTKALESLGLSLSNLCGILVTHEHSDHIKGLNVFLKKTKVPIFTGEKTAIAMDNMCAVPDGTTVVKLSLNTTANIEGFDVSAFSTSHDSAGCCGFRIKSSHGQTAAIATDLGEVCSNVYSSLQNAELVALESNYDPDSLRSGKYPWFLKKRIESNAGHLSNADCAKVIAALASDGCKKFAFCHLSAENNHPEFVRAALSDAFFEHGIKTESLHFQISKRFEASPWITF